jgi:hypothetical protein
MYIYDRKTSGSVQPIALTPTRRSSDHFERAMSGLLGYRGTSRAYVWTNQHLGDPTPEETAKRLMAELRPLFKKSFSKNRITYGPTVGNPVKIRVVADKDFKTEVTEEGKRLARGTMALHLKFAPELVLKDLQRFYKVMKQPFPDRLRTINERTRLTRDEQAAIFPLLQALTVHKATTEADKIGGLFSRSSNEIVLRDSQVDAGAVAHEMAHAYANRGWDNFIDMMRLRRMNETDKLDEGMTTLIERIVVDAWVAKQPSGTVVPLARYDSSYTDRARDFVKQLGRDPAFEAYFGGWIDFTNNATPEDTLVIGNKTKKKWKWPWR